VTILSLAPTGDEHPVGDRRERIYVGIDIGYREHVAGACPLSRFNPRPHLDAWRRVRTVRFSTDASGFKILQRYLDRHSPNPADFLVLMEPTGGYYALNVQTYLAERGYAVCVVDNRAVKVYREKVFGAETKTDDVDARLMARMGFLHEVVGEEFAIQPLRLADRDDALLGGMCRDLAHLHKEITRRSNQLQQVVAVTFPELKTFFTDSTARPAARAVLERFPTPRDLAAASPEEIAAVLRGARDYLHAKRAEELHALATSSVGLRTLSSHQWRQAWIIKQLPSLEEARDELVARLAKATRAHPYTPLIESLPITSPVWTASLIAVIGDVDRFPKFTKFKAYLGWFPRQDRSGASLDRSRLANSGVRLARRTLSQMVLILLTPAIRDTPFREHYKRLTARGMRKSAALGSVAGKLASVLYGMLKTGTAYDERRHRKAMGLPDLPEEGDGTTVPVSSDVVEATDLSDGEIEEIFEDSGTDSPLSG
jgi:transposase